MTEPAPQESFGELLERLHGDYAFLQGTVDAMRGGHFSLLVLEVVRREAGRHTADALLAAYIADRERLAVERYKQSNPNGRTVSFTGRVSGDCECFCWDDVPESELRAIDPVDRDEHDVPGRLYPNNVVWALGVPFGSKELFRFTVTVEPVATAAADRGGE